MPQKWNIETVSLEALKFDTRKEFATTSRAAYNKAVSLKILGDVCSHMPSYNCKWTEKTIREAAATFNTKKSFRENAKGAYEKAKTLEIFDEITAHMQHGTLPKWTIETITKKALEFTNTVDFNTQAGWVAERARHFGIYNDITSHMSKGKAKLMGMIPADTSGIYLLHAKGEVMYIGKASKCIRSRLTEHRKDKGFDKVTIKHISNLADMDILELYFINLYKPILNKDCNRESTTNLQFKNIDDIIAKTTHYYIKDTHEKHR